jgi:SAM-dependent methyltransferase
VGDRQCPACRSAEFNAGLRKGEWIYLRCAQCGLLALDPLPTAEEIEGHYQSKFARGNYELVRRYAGSYRSIHEQLAKWLDIRAGERVLDVGCFTGDLLEILAARGADVNGVELQREAVDIANERLGGGRVFQASVFGNEFPPGPYDVITMMGLIEHVLDPRAMIRRARQMLAPDGRLYLQTPNADSLIARLMRGSWPPLAPVEHIYLFGSRAIKTLLYDEGLGDVRTRAHVKRLPVGYVYEQFANFGGPAWQRAAAPLRVVLHDARLPFYGGEMFVSARVGRASTRGGAGTRVG